MSSQVLRLWLGCHASRGSPKSLSYSHDLSVFLSCPESDNFEFVAQEITHPRISHALALGWRTLLLACGASLGNGVSQALSSTLS